MMARAFLIVSKNVLNKITKKQRVFTSLAKRYRVLQPWGIHQLRTVEGGRSSVVRALEFKSEDPRFKH